MIGLLKIKFMVIVLRYITGAPNVHPEVREDARKLALDISKQEPPRFIGR